MQAFPLPWRLFLRNPNSILTCISSSVSCKPMEKKKKNTRQHFWFGISLKRFLKTLSLASSPTTELPLFAPAPVEGTHKAPPHWNYLFLMGLFSLCHKSIFKNFNPLILAFNMSFHQIRAQSAWISIRVSRVLAPPHWNFFFNGSFGIVPLIHFQEF